MQELIQIFAEGERIAAEKGNEELIAFYESKIKKENQAFNFLIKFNLSTAYQKSLNKDKTRSLLNEIIHEKPNFINAHFNLGILNDQAGDTESAIACWSEVEKRGNSNQKEQRQLIIQSLNQRARLEENRKNYNASIKYLERSLLLDPSQPAAIQHLVRSRQMIFDWPAFSPLGALREYHLMAATSPISMLAIQDDPRMQLLASLSFCSRTYTERIEPFLERPYSTKPKIRIGYVSGDFCTHAVGLLLPDFLANHNKEKFEVFGYDFGYRDGTQLRESILKTFDTVRDISSLSDNEAAKLIHNDNIDILVDMHGLSSRARPYIFAHRPGRLQVSWLGYIGTTSFPWIDCLVLDEFTFLDENAVYTSEKVVKLAYSFLPSRTNSCKAIEEQHQTSESSKNSPTFGCLNNTYKINPEVIALWANILKEFEAAKLMLCKESEDVAAKILAEFKRLGVSKSRITFMPRGTYQQYLVQLASIDVYLDTFPYSAGSVARDVVESNVPMVTLAGQTPVSRMCGGILKEYGLSELIAENKNDYKEKAINAMAGSSALKLRMQKHNKDQKLNLEVARCRDFEEKLSHELSLKNQQQATH